MRTAAGAATAVASRAERRLRLLALVPDAFGDPLGTLGGIALYNRDLLTAACEHPAVDEVVALPRLMPGPPGPLPPGLRYITRGLGGRRRYVGTVLGEAARGRFDLVLCGHLNLLPAAFAARVVTRAPVMAFVYGIEAWQPPPSRVARRLLRHVAWLVSIRPLTLERLHGWAGPLPARELLLETSIRLQQYGVGPKDPALLERYGLRGRRVLLTVARLDERFKGIDETLEVLPRLARDMPDIAYLVVGGGPDRTRLQEKARALGVHGRVVFAGAVDEADKTAHLRLGDAFVMPGTGHDFDTFPLRYAFLEALACGLPTVASRPEGPGEDTAGIGKALVLVDPRDPESIVQGIRAALARPREVPDALRALTYESFRARCHDMLDDLLGAGR